MIAKKNYQKKLIIIIISLLFISCLPYYGE